MESVLALLSIAAPLALMYSLYVLAQISQRFGEVTQRPPLYRAFYVAMVILLFPLAIRLLAPGMGDDSSGVLDGDTTEALLYNLSLVLSLTIALVTAWQYWGWLIHAQEEQRSPASRPVPRRR